MTEEELIRDISDIIWEPERKNWNESMLKAEEILAIPEIADGLTLRKLLQDNTMEDFLRWIEVNRND